MKWNLRTCSSSLILCSNLLFYLQMMWNQIQPTDASRPCDSNAYDCQHGDFDSNRGRGLRHPGGPLLAIQRCCLFLGFGGGRVPAHHSCSVGWCGGCLQEEISWREKLQWEIRRYNWRRFQWSDEEELILVTIKLTRLLHVIFCSWTMCIKNILTRLYKHIIFNQTACWNQEANWEYFLLSFSLSSRFTYLV